MKLARRLKTFLIHKIMPSLCQDCKVKMRKKFSLSGSIKRHGRKIRHHARRIKGHIKTIRVKIPHTKRYRNQKVQVLASGKYKFIKN